ncbi:MAG: hypothetical protein GY943_00625 [Chloroflexi bacterium]|nr:hypothetical protein [Chloroflexota bacterium]
MQKFSWKQPFIFLTFALIISACRSTTNPDTPELLPSSVLPTAPATTDNAAPQNAPQPLTPPPANTPVATGNAGDMPAPTATLQSLPAPTQTAVPAQINAPSYKVVFVTADDVLNVRAGAGVDNAIVGTLAPNAQNIQITGSGQVIANSTWVPITAGNVQGWVNSRFLTTAVSATTFCQDANVINLLDELVTAVNTQDNTRLAQLIHPERGVRIHYNWWNPAVNIAGNARTQFFTSTPQHDWGVADGTGFDINGSFSEIILPHLQGDLVNATESACNEILQGGTAGWVRLPDGYEAQYFYSFYFPGTAQYDGMDWGSWVVGIEEWQGTYYISTLIHYEWEI